VTSSALAANARARADTMETINSFTVEVWLNLR
jgi:hypothetical protein